VNAVLFALGIIHLMDPARRLPEGTPLMRRP